MLTIMLLREIRAGHINQVEGIGSIFAELTNCRIVRVEAWPKWWATHKCRYAWLKQIDLSDRAKIRLAVRTFYGIDPERLEKPDIVVSSGKESIPLTIWLKAWFGCKALFSGHARRAPHGETIDMQLVSSPRGVDSARCCITPVPGRVDARDYPPPRPILTSQDLRGARLGLLIGGDADSHRFSTADWTRMLVFLREVKDRYRVRWAATNSRRSPESLSPQLEALVKEGVIDEFVDYKKCGLSSAHGLFGSDLLVITEDSTSMLCEGLAAGRPVVALRPEWTAYNEFTETIAYQIGQGWMVSLAMETLEAAPFALAACGLRLPDWTVRGVLKDRLAALISAL